jgi:signal transduction histidine kinase
VLHGITADGAKLEVALDERLPPVRGDSLMLRRILENLIGNAVESLAGKPGGTVTITTEQVGLQDGSGRVRISVTDTGRGMSREELNRAFDDFYTTKPGGTGLGLSIVRRLILDLDGTLRVETEPGTGTRFVIELPTAERGAA